VTWRSLTPARSPPEVFRLRRVAAGIPPTVGEERSSVGPAALGPVDNLFDNLSPGDARSSAATATRATRRCEYAEEAAGPARTPPRPISPSRPFSFPAPFTVDGTLLESWASLKSFQPRDSSNNRPRGGTGGGRNAEAEFRGVPRKNDTHVSTTDPDARLFTKGHHQPAKLYYSGNVLMENRHGLVVDVRVAPATGRAETETALAMLHRHRARGGGRRWTVAADKAYDISDFVAGCRVLRVTPQVAQNITDHRGSRLDGRTVNHRGYTVGQRRRKCVEEIFGWMKTVGGGRKLRYVGVGRNQLWAEFTTSAYKLVRLAKLLPGTA
jgi:Transposase DDE domain